MDVDFSDFLSNHLVVAIKMAASNNKTDVISEKDLNLAIKGAEYLLEIYDSCKKLIHYVETQMTKIAPNLTEVVGTECAAQLISAAGGVNELALMPACNIQVLGSQRKANLGLAKKGQSMYYGFFGQLDMVKKAPEAFRTKLVKMLAN